MENNMKMRFAKLMSQMGQPNQISNPGIDDKMNQKQDLSQQLQLIDDKIAQLEVSSDPNSLESLTFWKNKRSELTGE